MGLGRGWTHDVHALHCMRLSCVGFDVWVGERVSRLFFPPRFFFCVGSTGVVDWELGVEVARVVYVGVVGFGLFLLGGGSLMIGWACCGAEGIVICRFLLGMCREGCWWGGVMQCFCLNR